MIRNKSDNKHIKETPNITQIQDIVTTLGTLVFFSKPEDRDLTILMKLENKI